MSSGVADPLVAGLLEQLGVAVGRLGRVEVELVDVADAYAYVRELEVVGRRVRALQAEVVGVIGRSGVHRVDGHASAKVMVRHGANLSPAEANRRGAAARVMGQMPLVGAAFASGDIGSCQVDRIARTHANARVRGAFEAQDANVAVLAARLPYRDFDAKLTDWERLEDQDGARGDAERTHRNRRYRIHTDFDGARRVDASWGAVQGAEVQAIHAHFRELEFHADWAEARERLGDAATVADLRRSEDQRCADAALAAWRAANRAHGAQGGGAAVVTNIVIDAETFDRELRYQCGDDPGPDPRAATILSDAIDDLFHDDLFHDDLFHDDLFHDDVLADESNDVDASAVDASARDQQQTPATGASVRPAAYRCCTGDGAPLHPAEAVAAALVGHVRRVVIGADAVVVDMGRLRRLFTGPQRDAVMLSGRRCSWVGCLVPASDCQADHLDSFNGPNQGRTTPGNGAPLCGRHNRLKHRGGFALYRDERGHIHVLRPDGTEIT